MRIALILLLAIPLSTVGQKKLYLVGGPQISRMASSYETTTHGDILHQGWRNTQGKTIFPHELGFNLAAHYRIAPRFAIESGVRFSQMSLITHDGYFMQTHNIKGGEPKNNFNGTYADNGNFNITEWYLSNYVSAYYFFAPGSAVQPYISFEVDYNYIVSHHDFIVSEFINTPTSEHLKLAVAYKRSYISGSLESGICIRPKPDHGIICFIGLKYWITGVRASADYTNQAGSVILYGDHLSVSGGSAALTIKIGGCLSKRGTTYK